MDLEEKASGEAVIDIMILKNSEYGLALFPAPNLSCLGGGGGGGRRRGYCRRAN